jgi:hypothetical protein
MPNMRRRSVRRDHEQIIQISHWRPREITPCNIMSIGLERFYSTPHERRLGAEYAGIDPARTDRKTPKPKITKWYWSTSLATRRMSDMFTICDYAIT